MLFIGGRRCILRHHAHRLVGDVELLQVGQLLGRQRQVNGPCRALDVVQLGGPHYRGRRLSQQPRQRNFRHAHPVLAGEFRHSGNNFAVLLRCAVIFAFGITVLLQALGGLSGTL